MPTLIRPDRARCEVIRPVTRPALVLRDWLELEEVEEEDEDEDEEETEDEEEEEEDELEL